MTGKPVWRTNTTRVRPFGRGGFYSSPAIAFGRVYAGRDDGTVFASDRLHRLLRRASLALNALSGKQEWEVRRRRAGARHGDRDRQHRLHLQLQDPRRDRHRRPHAQKDLELPQAGYTPVVSDGRHLYLIGYYEVIGLEPK